MAISGTDWLEANIYKAYFQAYFKEYHHNFYGLKNGTNVPPF